MSARTPDEHLLDDLMPTNELIQGMWVSFLGWALGSEDIVSRFREDTGNRYSPGRTTIERMVDQATGYEAAFLREFAQWLNKTHWGEVNGRAANGDEPEGIPPGGILEES